MNEHQSRHLRDGKVEGWEPSPAWRLESPREDFYLEWEWAWWANAHAVCSGRELLTC